MITHHCTASSSIALISSCSCTSNCAPGKSSEMSKRPRSQCWNYFIKDGDIAKCMVDREKCKTDVKHCGNTTNMLKHLKSCHIEEYKNCVSETVQTKKARLEATPSSKQLTLEESSERSMKYPRESSKCKILDNALIEMIATDLQPLSIVEDKGFIKYTSLLDPRYQLPCRKTVSTKLLPAKYQEASELLMTKLGDASTIAVTTDIWSSRQGLSYCCLTAHTISNDWELQSYVLSMFHFSNDHTGQHIADELGNIVSQWGSPTISCCVTDNASNMISGIEKAEWNHLPCFAHTLNLVVQDSIGLHPLLRGVKEKGKSIL